MSSSIYEEALADVKKLKEVAEQNAKNAIIDAVTPRIREMIEKQLVGAADNEQGDILNDLAESLLEDGGEDIQLTSESLKALSDLVNTDSGFSAKDAELSSLLVQERLLVVMDTAPDAGPDINELAEMKAQIYSAHQSLLENRSTVQAEDFDRIQKRLASLDYFLTEAIGETEMNNRDLRSILDEEALRLVLDLGDDVEVDQEAVSVNVESADDEVVGEESEEEVAEEDVDTAEAGDVEDDEEVEEEESEVELTQAAAGPEPTAGDAIAEGDTADDEMIEINEEQLASMIRSILNEEDADEQDDDMDEDWGSKEGEKHRRKEDGVEHAVDPGSLDYDEGLMMPDEQDAMDEEAGDDDDRDADDEGSYVMEGELSDDTVVEISESMLRDELAKLRGLKESVEETTATTTESNETEGDLTEEVAQLKAQLQEYEKAVSSLRSQLDESNLFNAKLLYANKLLQNRGLTDRQRVHIVESLDGAKSLREVRLLYKSLTESVETTKGNLTESKRRRAAGSASRPTRTGSASSESFPETDRWALLAGINK